MTEDVSDFVVESCSIVDNNPERAAVWEKLLKQIDEFPSLCICGDLLILVAVETGAGDEWQQREEIAFLNGNS